MTTIAATSITQAIVQKFIVMPQGSNDNTDDCTSELAPHSVAAVNPKPQPAGLSLEAQLLMMHPRFDPFKTIMNTLKALTWHQAKLTYIGTSWFRLHRADAAAAASQTARLVELRACQRKAAGFRAWLQMHAHLPKLPYFTLWRAQSELKLKTELIIQALPLLALSSALPRLSLQLYQEAKQMVAVKMGAQMRAVRSMRAAVWHMHGLVLARAQAITDFQLICLKRQTHRFVCSLKDGVKDGVRDATSMAMAVQLRPGLSIRRGFKTLLQTEARREVRRLAHVEVVKMLEEANQGMRDAQRDKDINRWVRRMSDARKPQACSSTWGADSVKKSEGAEISRRARKTARISAKEDSARKITAKDSARKITAKDSARKITAKEDSSAQAHVDRMRLGRAARMATVASA
jgi:hypothetical protein